MQQFHFWLSKIRVQVPRFEALCFAMLKFVHQFLILSSFFSFPSSLFFSPPSSSSSDHPACSIEVHDKCVHNVRFTCHAKGQPTHFPCLFLCFRSTQKASLHYFFLLVLFLPFRNCGGPGSNLPNEAAQALIPFGSVDLPECQPH